MKALQQKQYPYSAKTKKGGRANGSDFSSARGSEERHTSVAAQTGRGPRRNRDYDLEQVSVGFILLLPPTRVRSLFQNLRLEARTFYAWQSCFARPEHLNYTSVNH